MAIDRTVEVYYCGHLSMGTVPIPVPSVIYYQSSRCGACAGYDLSSSLTMATKIRIGWKNDRN